MTSQNRLMPTLVIALLVCSCPLARGEETPGKDFVRLFNGKNLDGWQQYNGTAKYRVEEGCVVGTTNEGSPNSFLCTKKEYSDFELQFEVKVDDQLNSGVQIRSKTRSAKPSDSSNEVGCFAT